MSDEIKKEDLMEVYGGAEPQLDSAGRNIGGKCKWFECNECGAKPFAYDVVYTLGICVRCGIIHEATCPWRAVYWNDPEGSCSICKHAQADGGCAV